MGPMRVTSLSSLVPVKCLSGSIPIAPINCKDFKLLSRFLVRKRAVVFVWVEVKSTVLESSVSGTSTILVLDETVLVWVVHGQKNCTCVHGGQEICTYVGGGQKNLCGWGQKYVGVKGTGGGQEGQIWLGSGEWRV